MGGRDKCNRCGGTFRYDSRDNVLICINCSNRIYFDITKVPVSLVQTTLDPERASLYPRAYVEFYECARPKKKKKNFVQFVSNLPQDRIKENI